MWLIAVMGLSLLAGLLLVRRGWRGRVLDDHPVCVRCRYDLSGSMESERKTCPECGAELAGKRAVVIGNRVRRPMATGVGLALLAVSLLTGVMVFQFMDAEDWRHMEPVALLRLEARWYPQATAPLDELIRRLQAGALSKEQINNIADDALVVQGDLAIHWKPKWGDFVEEAQYAGSLDPAKWETYGHQAIRDIFQLELRPRVRLGDPVPYSLLGATARVGNEIHGQLWVQIEGRSVNVDGYTQQFNHGFYASLDVNNSNWMNSNLNLDSTILETLTPGRCKLSMHIRLSVYEGAMLSQDDVILEDEFDLLPADQPSVRAVTDEPLSQVVRDALGWLEIEMDFVEQNAELYIGGSIRVERLPVGLAFDVFARDRASGQEWSCGSVCMVANREDAYGLGGIVPNDFDAQSVDVILRPSAEMAAGSIDVFDYWGEQVVIENVPVDWSAVPAAQRPVQSSP
ncbi:MAG: hypothetical protein IT445_16180 [Phycisphaeraceae bacterium]|nr:hypothetical protein [Phycisphaeraceae bacterium]